MPDPVPVTPTTTPAVPPPVTGTPHTRPNGGNKPGESIMDAFNRLGGFGDDAPAEGSAEGEPNGAATEGAEADAGASTDDTAAAGDKEAKPEAKPEPKKKDATPPAEAKQAQLRELAKELGFEVDGTKVTSKERNEFREAKKRQKQGLESVERELMAKITAAQEQVKKDGEKVAALVKATAAGDYEGIAQALGHKNWEDLQGAVIAQLSDPNYKEMRELKAWKEEQEQKQKDETAQRERQADEQRRRAAVAEYTANLAKDMAASDNKVLATMAEDPWFVSAIHQIQRAEYDGSSTVSAAEALDMKPPGSRITLREQLQVVKNRLVKAFGEEKPAAEAAPAPAAAKPAPKPATRQTSRTNVLPSAAKTEPSAPSRAVSEAEWRAQARRRLEAAIDEDRKAGRFPT